jgi:hypothetical protein
MKKWILVTIIVIIASIMLRHTLLDVALGTTDCGQNVHMAVCVPGFVNFIKTDLVPEHADIYITNINGGDYGGTAYGDNILLYKGFTNLTAGFQRFIMRHEYFHTMGRLSRFVGWSSFGYSKYEEGLAEYYAADQVGKYDFECVSDGMYWKQGILTTKSSHLSSGKKYYYDTLYDDITLDDYAKAYCVWKLTENKYGKEKTMGFMKIYNDLLITSDRNVEKAYLEYFGEPVILEPLIGRGELIR